MDDTDSSEDTPDEKAGDEKAGEGEDKAGDDGKADDSDDDGSPSEERLEEVGQHIEQARSKAEDAVEGVEAHEERFVDSGSEESKEADDQTDAPG